MRLVSVLSQTAGWPLTTHTAMDRRVNTQYLRRDPKAMIEIGADSIHVGMSDFQVAENAAITKESVADVMKLDRRRKQRG